MQKMITARHFELTNEMRLRAEEEIDGLTRYFDNIISAELVLDIERHRRKAELRVKAHNSTLTGSGDTDDMYTSIAAAVEKVKGQLKKFKGKLKERRPEEITEAIDEITRPSTDIEGLE